MVQANIQIKHYNVTKRLNYYMAYMHTCSEGKSVIMHIQKHLPSLDYIAKHGK